MTPTGFTLVELLVVISIIGVLVALLLPAVQSIREAGRQTTCRNNLKQLACAITAHETAQQYLPDGGEVYWCGRIWINSSPAVAPKQYWGWTYQILPYIDQQALWEQPKDADVFKVPLAIYSCPTRRRPSVVLNIFAGGQPRAMMDYAANAGTDDGPQGVGTAGNTGWGLLGNGRNAPIIRRPDGSAHRCDRPISSTDVLDGMSNTLLLGEKCLNVGLLNIHQTDDDSGWVDGWDWDHMRWGYFPPTPDFSDSDSRVAHSGYANLHGSFGSSHLGLFNTALCDGSVRTIAFSVNLDVFKRLSAINDGGTFGATDF